MTDADQLSALERLTKLRESGALSEDEFAAQKTTLLSRAQTRPVLVPFYRRLWLVVTLTVLLVTFCIALIILVSGDVYKRAKDGSLTPIKKGTRNLYAGALALWLVALIVQGAIDPNSLKNKWENSASTVRPEATAAQTPSTVSSPAAPSPKQPTSSAATEAAPEMSVQSGPSPATNAMTISITANDDRPFTVQRVVINGRKSEQGCDIVHSDDTSDLGYTVLKTPLKRGDTEQVLVQCGDKVLSADIYTDRGMVSFKFDYPTGN